MNTQATTAKTAIQTADIRYRVQLKNRPHIVVYQVMSSNGHDMYDVILVNGKTNNCTCKSRKPCYHMRDVQSREDARTAKQVAPVQEPQATESEPRRNYAPLNGERGFSLYR